MASPTLPLTISGVESNQGCMWLALLVCLIPRSSPRQPSCLCVLAASADTCDREYFTIRRERRQHGSIREERGREKTEKEKNDIYYPCFSPIGKESNKCLGINIL